MCQSAGTVRHVTCFSEGDRSISGRSHWHAGLGGLLLDCQRLLMQASRVRSCEAVDALLRWPLQRTLSMISMSKKNLLCVHSQPVSVNLSTPYLLHRGIKPSL